jgi:TPP-dependent pyruvate/acetoin dehydrogenase alpha subunit
VPAAVKDWYQFSDPLLIFIRKLLADGQASKDQIVQLEKSVREKIAEAIQFAFASPQPDLQSALEGVFV